MGSLGLHGQLPTARYSVMFAVSAGIHGAELRQAADDHGTLCVSAPS